MQNTNYKEQYGKALDTYRDMLKNYEEATTSEKYHEILGTMPFEFLNALQLCEKLSLYEKLEKKPRMYFSSLEEATVFYKNLISFNKKTENLLENAAYIVEIGKIADNLNEYVRETPYLNPNFLVESNEDIIDMAKRCLSEIPKFPQMLTKKFRWNFIESAILSLDKPSLKWMVESKIIKSADIDNIKLTEETNDYHSKIEFLCQILNHPQPIIATYQLKLKGVTFPNDDGSSRQKNLEMLEKYVAENSNDTISLTAESYTYTPEFGEPEPAIKIAWDGKVIGNISKTAAKEITEKYNNPQFKVTLEKISGSNEDGMSYGCIVNLSVIAPGYSEQSAEVTKNAETIEQHL